MNVFRIGIVGDYNPAYTAHVTTDGALRDAAESLGGRAAFRWIPTESLASGDLSERLAAFDGLWISAGSPYRSRDGALRAIRFARERGRPMVAT